MIFLRKFRIKQNCTDPLLKNDWKKVHLEIQAEISVVQELANMIKGIIVKSNNFFLLIFIETNS